jgi:hypothetical protein
MLAGAVIERDSRASRANARPRVSRDGHGAEHARSHWVFSPARTGATFGDHSVAATAQLSGVSLISVAWQGGAPRAGCRLLARTGVATQAWRGPRFPWSSDRRSGIGSAAPCDLLWLMATLSELEDTLPWGLHDAYIERIEIDWIGRRAVLGVRAMISERQDMDQRAKVILDGLVYCSIDPPEIDPARGYEATPADGLWVNSASGLASTTATGHPAPPAGHFVHYFFVHNWNRSIHVCAESARLKWIEPTPVPARAGTRALYPGDQVSLD